MLQIQPLVVSDFSGGVTDNYFQADPRFYEKADNLLIETDRSLRGRDGLIPFSNGGYYLGNASQHSRVNLFFTAIKGEEHLLAGSGRSIYYFDKHADSWQEILGMGSNSALQGGGVFSQVSFGEFQRQVYLTNDGENNSNGTLPSKIYRDKTNQWVARTAGLPRAFVPGNFTEGSLLDACISLANAIRTAMIDHMEDAVHDTTVINPADFLYYNQLHVSVDFVSLSYLKTPDVPPEFMTDPTVLSLFWPNGFPTPAPAATDEASLFTLIEALNNAYTIHFQDNMSGAYGWPLYWNKISNGPIFHKYSTTAKGPGAFLENNAKPDEVEEAAAMLNDLFQKWNWHRKAFSSHNLENNFLLIDKYQINAEKIPEIQIGNATPTFTGNYGDVIACAENLRYLYECHVKDQLSLSDLSGLTPGVHKRKQLLSMVDSFPQVTNIEDAYILIYWLRAGYYIHQQDAALAYGVKINGTLTSGSPNITSVTRTDTGAAFDAIAPFASYRVVEIDNYFAFTPLLGQDGGGGWRTARIDAASSGTINADRIATVTGSNNGQVTNSQWHSAMSVVTPATIEGVDVYDFATTETSPQKSGEILSNESYLVGTDTDSWLTLASDLFSALYTHMTNPALHSGMGALGIPQTATPGAQWLASYFRFMPYPDFFIPTVGQYGYAFFFSHDYVVEPNGIEYKIVGNPVFAGPFEGAVSYPLGTLAPNQPPVYTTWSGSIVGTNSSPSKITTVRGNLLTNLPVLTNTADTNYDLENIKLNIYRTTDGGTTYYLVAQVDNGTTEYTDTLNDTISGAGSVALNLKEQLYTTGGLLGFDQPPICKFIHTIEGVTYYGAITDTGQYFPQRIMQSVEDNPDAVPATNFLDLDDELVGLSSARSKLIAFCESSIYRVEGGYNLLGQGSLIPDAISDECGCLNQKGIVKTEIGVFFPGTDGFYYTDGYQNVKITTHLDDTYKALTASDSQKRGIYGAYDKENRRIWWSMKSTETSPQNDIVATFHLNFGVKPPGAFTFHKNGLNFQPSSMVFKQGVLYVGHEKGAILKSAWYAKFDSIVDMTIPAVDWERLYVPFWFKSAAIDLGTSYNRKWITKVHLVGKNQGNMLLQPWVLRDLNQTQAGRKAMTPINYAVNNVICPPVCEWGDPDFKWQYDGKMDVWRRFPTSVLRSDFVQLELTPAYGPVYASSVGYPDFDGLNTNVSFLLKEVSLISYAPYTNIVWPTDIVNYKISFSIDNYETEYEITAVNGEVLTFDYDGAETASFEKVEWQIMGYSKEQRFSLKSLDFHFAYLGDKNQKFPGRSSDSGPGNGGYNP